MLTLNKLVYIVITYFNEVRLKNMEVILGFGFVFGFVLFGLWLVSWYEEFWIRNSSCLDFCIFSGVLDFCDSDWIFEGWGFEILLGCTKSGNSKRARKTGPSWKICWHDWPNDPDENSEWRTHTRKIFYRSAPLPIWPAGI